LSSTAAAAIGQQAASGQDHGRPWERHPEAAALANPFRGRLVLHEDLASTRELYGQALPLEQIAPPTPTVPWWHYGLALTVGTLPVVAGIHPPLRMTVLEQSGLSVFLGYAGEQRAHQAGRRWTCRADGCLILCGEAFAWESDLGSGLSFSLSLERLLATAQAMAGLEAAPAAWSARLQRSQACGLSADPEGAPLQALLRQEWAKADALLRYSHALLDGLQLDDQIHRLMAALLLPELRLESPLHRLSQNEQRGRDSFDDLVDYIRLHLAEPLTLTMLEQRSHYSRRALQYAFRKRLGCTATQWIRRERLELARRDLQHPSPADSVAVIALRCGYRSLSLFSVEFQQRFHVKPPQLLREARASQPAGRDS
jgi:AraC-like DNA-binding protein